MFPGRLSRFCYLSRDPRLRRLEKYVKIRVFEVFLIMNMFVACTKESSECYLEVPCGAADQTLYVFARQANVEILFVPESMKSVRTHELKGWYRPNDAIHEMFRGSNVRVICEERHGSFAIYRLKGPDE